MTITSIVSYSKSQLLSIDGCATRDDRSRLIRCVNLLLRQLCIFKYDSRLHTVAVVNSGKGSDVAIIYKSEILHKIDRLNTSSLCKKNTSDYGKMQRCIRTENERNDREKDPEENQLY